MFIYNVVIHKTCPLNCPECRSYLYEPKPFSVYTGYIPSNSIVNLIGGDPLCAPDLNAIIQDLKNKNCKINILSSCYYLPENLTTIKNTTVFWLTQSFNKDEYKELCGRNFEQALSNIKILIKNKINVVPCLFISNHNIDNLPEVKDILPDQAPLWIEAVKNYIPETSLQKNNIENIKYYAKGFHRICNVVEKENAGICPFIPAFNSISSKIKLALINYSYSDYSINSF